MAWFRVIDKATRERQHVQCRPSEVRRQYPMERYFLPRQLGREPGEADVFVGGALVPDEAMRAAIDREAALARMTHAERFDATVAAVVARLAGEDKA